MSLKYRNSKARFISIVLLISLLGVSSSLVTSANAQVEPSSIAWFTVAATAVGNYPGGVIGFNVFAVDSALKPGENVSIERMTVVTPWSNYSQTSLPVTLTPGEAYSSFINATIPTSFSNSTFSVSFTANAQYWNGSAWIGFTETARVAVQVLALPAKTSSSTPTLIALGGIPTLVAIILAALLIRERGRKSSVTLQKSASAAPR